MSCDQCGVSTHENLYCRLSLWPGHDASFCSNKCLLKNMDKYFKYVNLASPVPWCGPLAPEISFGKVKDDYNRLS